MLWLQFGSRATEKVHASSLCIQIFSKEQIFAHKNSCCSSDVAQMPSSVGSALLGSDGGEGPAAFGRLWPGVAAALWAPGEEGRAGKPTLQGPVLSGVRERPSLSRGVAYRPPILERTCRSVRGYLQSCPREECGFCLCPWRGELRGLEGCTLEASGLPRAPVVVFPGPGGCRGLGARPGLWRGSRRESWFRSAYGLPVPPSESEALTGTVAALAGVDRKSVV